MRQLTLNDFHEFDIKLTDDSIFALNQFRDIYIRANEDPHGDFASRSKTLRSYEVAIRKVEGAIQALEGLKRKPLLDQTAEYLQNLTDGKDPEKRISFGDPIDFTYNVMPQPAEFCINLLKELKKCKVALKSTLPAIKQLKSKQPGPSLPNYINTFLLEIYYTYTECGGKDTLSWDKIKDQSSGPFMRFILVCFDDLPENVQMKEIQIYNSMTDIRDHFRKEI